MTVTVQRLIQWLQEQPQDAIVELARVTGHDYGGAIVSMRPLEEKDFGDLVDVIDLRGNSQVAPNKPYYGKVYVQFGNT